MFLDLKDPWPPPPPNEPAPPRPRLTPRGQKVMAWIVIANVALLLFGPLAGSSVLDGLAHLFTP